MKEIVMCKNNSRLKRPLTSSTDHQSLLEHCDFDFQGGGGGGGVTVILNLIFRRAG